WSTERQSLRMGSARGPLRANSCATARLSSVSSQKICGIDETALCRDCFATLAMTTLCQCEEQSDEAIFAPQNHCERVVIDAEPQLQRPIGNASLALEQREHLFPYLVEPHGQSSHSYAVARTKPSNQHHASSRDCLTDSITCCCSS